MQALEFYKKQATSFHLTLANTFSNQLNKQCIGCIPEYNTDRWYILITMEESANAASNSNKAIFFEIHVNFQQIKKASRNIPESLFNSYDSNYCCAKNASA